MQSRVSHIRRALIHRLRDGELRRYESCPLRATYCGAVDSGLSLNPRRIRGGYSSSIREVSRVGVYRVRLLPCRECFRLLYRERSSRSSWMPTEAVRRWRPSFSRPSVDVFRFREYEA